MLIRWIPADVPVTDDRGTVPGARLYLPDGTEYLLIPPEGPDCRAWMGLAGDGAPEGMAWEEWVELCDAAAYDGAAGRSGAMPLIEVECRSIDEVYAYLARATGNTIAATKHPEDSPERVGYIDRAACSLAIALESAPAIARRQRVPERRSLGAMFLHAATLLRDARHDPVLVPSGLIDRAHRMGLWLERTWPETVSTADGDAHTGGDHD